MRKKGRIACNTEFRQLRLPSRLSLRLPSLSAQPGSERRILEKLTLIFRFCSSSAKYNCLLKLEGEGREEDMNGRRRDWYNEQRERGRANDEVDAMRREVRREKDIDDTGEGGQCGGLRTRVESNDEDREVVGGVVGESVLEELGGSLLSVGFALDQVDGLLVRDDVPELSRSRGRRGREGRREGREDGMEGRKSVAGSAEAAVKGEK